MSVADEILARVVVVGADGRRVRNQALAWLVIVQTLDGTLPSDDPCRVDWESSTRTAAGVRLDLAEIEDDASQDLWEAACNNEDAFRRVLEEVRS